MPTNINNDYRYQVMRYSNKAIRFYTFILPPAIYICIYIYVHVYMYVCMHTYVCFTSFPIHIYIYIHIHAGYLICMLRRP